MQAMVIEYLELLTRIYRKVSVVRDTMNLKMKT